MNSIQSAKWHEVIVLLKKKLPPISYDTWVKPLKLKDIDDEKNIIRLEFLNDFFIKIFKARYLMTLKETINSVFEKEYDVIFTLPEDQDTRRTNDKEQPESKLEQENYIDPNYTFDNFVVGANNMFAHAGAVAVAEDPSNTYNPFFIYGGSGLGKTHLMHAIGGHILKTRPDLKVLYVSAEMFANELIEAIMRDDNSRSKNYAFKEKYRNIDVLLIDDIQFLENKEKTQEEFFHTFNALHSMQKQIVISSDREPGKLVNLDERLRSRFSWNLIADIQPPDYETRVAILLKKAESIPDLEVDDDVREVINIIADKVKYNVRELEGAFTRLQGFANIMHKKINVKFAKQVIKDVVSSDEAITPEIIKRNVSSYFKIKNSDLESSKRSKNIAFPRQIAMYLCREMTDLSYPKIGEKFGGKDHTTVLHAFDKISSEMKTNPDTKRIVDELRDKLNDL